MANAFGQPKRAAVHPFTRLLHLADVSAVALRRFHERSFIGANEANFDVWQEWGFKGAIALILRTPA